VWDQFHDVVLGFGVDAMVLFQFFGVDTIAFFLNLGWTALRFLNLGWTALRFLNLGWTQGPPLHVFFALVPNAFLPMAYMKWIHF